jgi:sugar phosphate isomerase/epimerase
MKLEYFCPRWGSEALPWPEFCGRVKEAGYDGVETSLPPDEGRTGAILEALAATGLSLIAQQHESSGPDLELFRSAFRMNLERLAAAKPAFVNSQTGKDWFPPEWNKSLIETAREVSERTGVAILHETHRGKFSFSAAATASFLRDDPELRISADFSHWCAVSESLLADQQESVALAISRTDHIHARVGHPEGAQVSDPRAPEWKAALEAHLGWWDSIVDKHRRAGSPVLTVTPEFGPAPYMPALPFSSMPVADQWGINGFMLELLRARWG